MSRTHDFWCPQCQIHWSPLDFPEAHGCPGCDHQGVYDPNLEYGQPQTEYSPEDLSYPADLQPLLDRFPQEEGWAAILSVGTGWYPLIKELDQEIAKIAPDYQVHQVKEKFGGLRYYINYSAFYQQERYQEIEQIEEIIRQAEAKSRSICERCGNQGNRSNNGG